MADLNHKNKVLASQVARAVIVLSKQDPLETTYFDISRSLFSFLKNELNRTGVYVQIYEKYPIHYRIIETILTPIENGFSFHNFYGTNDFIRCVFFFRKQWKIISNCLEDDDTQADTYRMRFERIIEKYKPVDDLSIFEHSYLDLLEFKKNQKAYLQSLQFPTKKIFIKSIFSAFKCEPLAGPYLLNYIYEWNRTYENLVTPEEILHYVFTHCTFQFLQICIMNGFINQEMVQNTPFPGLPPYLLYIYPTTKDAPGRNLQKANIIKQQKKKQNCFVHLGLLIKVLKLSHKVTKHLIQFLKKQNSLVMIS